MSHADVSLEELEELEVEKGRLCKTTSMSWIQRVGLGDRERSVSFNLVVLRRY